MLQKRENLVMGGLGHANWLYYVTIAATMHAQVQGAQRCAVISGIRAGKTTRENADLKTTSQKAQKNRF